MMTTMMNAIFPSSSSLRRRRLIMNNISYLFVFLSLVTMMRTTTTVMAEEQQEEEEEEEDYVNESRIRRINSKPWLMREFQLLDIPNNVYEKIIEIIESQFGHGHGNISQKIPKQIFISPFTIICLAIIFINIWSFLSYHLSGSWVEGSHILVKDTSVKTHKGLLSLRDQLGSNYKLFGSSAKEYSQCPSSEQNGDLGRFAPGSMAPSFDKICFDPNTPVGQTIGPIQTKHGYHLIYIRKRKF
jgi:peptidyl-prolyl cis-trans isomerase C